MSDGDAAVVEAAGRILREGGLVAIPTETVYGLGGDALDPVLLRRFMPQRDARRIIR